MKESTIKKLGDEWIKRLRLQDYDIRLYVASASSIEEDAGRSCYGYCLSSTDHMSAEVCLLHPSEEQWMKGRGIEFGSLKDKDLRIELTLVHELLHIMFEHGRTPENILTEETMVNRLAMSMLKLKYASPPQKPTKKIKKETKPKKTS